MLGALMRQRRLKGGHFRTGTGRSWPNTVLPALNFLNSRIYVYTLNKWTSVLTPRRVSETSPRAGSRSRWRPNLPGTAHWSLKICAEIYDERRFQALGLVGERLHVMVFTHRADKAHVISLRKANKREVKRYEAQAQSRKD